MYSCEMRSLRLPDRCAFVRARREDISDVLITFGQREHPMAASRAGFQNREKMDLV
jgi:hypothetical protein